MIEIEVSGVDEFLAGVDRLDSSLDRVVIDSETFAAETTIDVARPNVPVQSGAAVASLRVVDLGGGAAATGGNAAVPYYGWLEFGGDAGRNHSVHRPVVRMGRYLHPAFLAAQDRIERHMQDRLADEVREARLS